MTDPISMDPARRPPDPVDVAQLSGVTTVSACQYELAESRRVVEQNEAALVGSVLLTGADAAAAIRRVVAAPVRRGWNRATCSVDYGSNTSGVVLRIASDQGEHLVYMHYYCSLCGQNGFDDGVRLRSLTPRSVEPFLGDANAVTFDSEEWLPLPGMRS